MNNGARAAKHRKTRSLRQLLWQCCLDALEPRTLLSANVLEWRVDQQGTGNNAQETTLTPANVNSTDFGRIGSISLGTVQVYAQPLYVGGLTITGNGSNNGVHNVVFIAAENDKVYAYDSDTLLPVWNSPLTIGTFIPKTGEPAGGPNLVNFSNGIGITGTPVITMNTSGTTGTMYLDATSLTGAASGADQFAHIICAVNISSGTVIAAHTLSSLTGTLPTVLGNASDGNGTVVTFNVAKHLQRPGLIDVNHTIYVAYGSYGDTDPYHGWVMGFDDQTLALKSVFCTTPNNLLVAVDGSHSGEGSIWMSGAALTSDGTNIFLVTANGDFDPTNVYSWSDSVLKLTPDSNIAQTSTTGLMTNGYGIHVSDYFTPYNQQTLGNFTIDLDLGSTGAILMPDHNNEVFIGSKQGVLYVMNSSDMGGYNATGSSDTNVFEEVSLNGKSTRNSPAYFNSTIYVQGSNDTLQAFPVAANGMVASAPAIAASTTPFPSYGSTPFVSSNGTSDGIVWETLFSGSAQVLYAFDATTLSVLYTSAQKTGDNMGGGPHFTNPVVADGKVFVGGNNGFYVYGEQTPAATTPAAPSGLSVFTSNSMTLTLNWAQSSANETGFLIERSANDTTNFTQIASVGIDVTTYTDSTVTVGTTYFYRVRSTNPSGSSAYSATASGTDPALSIVGNLWHFDSGTGTSAPDSGFSTNNGTLGGSTTLPTWVTGFNGSGSALNFNGVAGAMTDSSSTPQGAVVTLTNSVNGFLGGTGATMTAWIKTIETGNNDPTLAPAIVGAYQVNSSGADAGNDMRWGYIDASGHIGVSVDGRQATPAPGDTWGVVSNVVVNDGQWHAVAFTRNSVNGLLQVFVDGVLAGSYYGDVGTKSPSMNLIGAQINKNSGGTVIGHTYYVGSLDELHIYNQILNPTEIAELAVAPGIPTGLNATPVSSTSIQLTWNAENATAYDIYRRTGTSGSFAPLISIQGDLTSFTDTLLTTGTQYFYEIRAGDPIGTSGFTTPVSAVANTPGILNRYTFYNNSFYDGGDSGNNANDDGAIALDKTALLPSATGTFANYTSYDKGLTGILVDITGTLSGFTAADITLKTGNNNSPASWTSVSDATVNFRMIPGGGGTRIDITMPSGEVVNAWLQVTIASTHTQLAGSDQFYFGNAPGESGDNPSNAQVNATDEIGARAFAANLATQSNATAITNVYDYNRDKQVSPADEAVAGAHYTNVFTGLNLITTPVGPLALPADTQVGLPADTGTPTTDAATPTAGTGTPTAGTVTAFAVTPEPAPDLVIPPAAPSSSNSPPASSDSPAPSVPLADTSPTVVTVRAKGKQRKAPPPKPPAPVHVPHVNTLKKSAFSKVFELLASKFGR